MDRDYYQNKYRVSSTRLPGWDYGWPGLYFVTICAYGKECYLGEIKNNDVYLSESGKIVFDCWLDIPRHFDNAGLDDWIIMPNHVHGIIVIKNEDNDFGRSVCRRDMACHVSTTRKFGKPQPKSLSSIIGSFKSAASKKCHKNNLDFYWQKIITNILSAMKKIYSASGNILPITPPNGPRTEIIR